MLQTKSDSQMFTYQTRLTLGLEALSILSTYAAIMGKTERALFADVQKGIDISKSKPDYLKRFEITARQFNSLRVAVEGKIASVKEKRKEQISELTHRITSLEKKIGKIKSESTRHQKKRRLFGQRAKLQRLQKEEALGRVPLCFGSRKLFRAQFHLEENGYDSHEEWKSEWQQARANEIFLLGSKDETGGNQSCTARIEEDNSLTLRLRLPDSMVLQFGKYVEIPHVRFSYGHDVILASLRSCINRKTGDKESGIAITYRFQRDEKGWRLFASTSLQKPTDATNAALGAIGVDINVDHLAVTEVDRFGNCVKHKKIPLPLQGRNSSQTKAIIGDAAKEVVNWCTEANKPLVLEKLCFQEKKTTLREETSAKQARVLSSFAYNNIIQTMKSRSFRFGVKVHQVNPAYTSIIGRCKFARIYGLSIHESAAMTIARRFQGVSESLPRALEKIPDGKGDHVTLSLPVRNRGEHVWTLWRKVGRELRVAPRGHLRATKCWSSGSSACCDVKNTSDFAGETLHTNR